MRRTRHIALTGCIALALSAAAAAQNLVPWTGDLMQAHQMAAQQRRLVLLHFWAQDCPPCQILEQRVFNRPEVARAIGVNYVPVKINAKQAPDLARRYQIRQWPTDVIVTADGTEVYRTVSPQNPNQYIALLDQLAANYRVAGSAQVAADAVRASQGPASMPAPGQPAGYGNRTSAFQPSGPMPANGPGPGSLAAAYASAPAATRWGSPPASDAAGQTPGPAWSAGAPQARANQFAAKAPNGYGPSSPPSNPAVPARGYAPPAGSAWNAPSPSSPAGSYAPAASPSPQATVNQWAVSAPAPSAAPGPPAWQANPAATSSAQANPASSASASAPQAPATGPAPPSSSTAPIAQAPGGDRPVALEGYCAVTLLEQQKWIKADPRWGAVHRDQTYLFAGPSAQEKFLADPDRYAPVLSGYDPVVYSENGQLVEGKRAHGVFYHNRVYLFSGEGALQRFWQAPDRYAQFVQQAMQRTDLNR